MISLGKGTITFESQESANLAVESSNGKFLPEYETWKNPLFVDFFRSSYHRNESNVLKNYNEKNLNGFNIMGNYNNVYQGKQMYGYNNNYGNNSYYAQNNYIGGNGNQTNTNFYGYQNDGLNTNLTNQMNNLSLNKKEFVFQDLDMTVFNNLLDHSSKIDFLGELIYSNISKHPFATKMNISMEEIGKITGMLLGLENLEEIVAVCKSEKELTSRLEEGLQLIRTPQA